jgi:hypothetical protein
LSCSAILLGALGVTEARADVLAPPPPSCEAGSVGEDCHGPPLCRALTCETNADCGAGRVCVGRPLCARRDQCCSGRACGDETVERYTHIEGPCGAGNSCDAWGTACETIKVCVPGASSPDAGSTATDAGATDAGSAPADAGRDGGGTDSGPIGPRDSGRDAGGGTVAGGGCCSATGARSGAGGALFAVLMLVTALRRARRG